jgi:hypothetical protein
VVLSSLRIRASVAIAADGVTPIELPHAEYVESTTLIDISGLPSFGNVSSITDGTMTVSFSSPMNKRGPVPTGWRTWSEPPFSETPNPHILTSNGEASMTLTLSLAAGIFGFELEPNPFSSFDYTVAFFNGENLVGSITSAASGSAGARLFAAATNGLPFDRLVITGDADFAIARVRYRSHGDEPDREGPVTIGTTASPNPIAVREEVHLAATVDDENTGASNVASAEYSLAPAAAQNVLTDSWTAMSPSDGAFDTPTEEVEASFDAPAEAGSYELCVRGTDEAGNLGTVDCTALDVYDPSAFATGGGWIDSPEGAYREDPSATGKANFGFVSKYKKGATVPGGSIEFQLRAGKLNFHGSSYDLLIVTAGGTQAEIRGSGTLNGDLAPNGSEFECMIWVRDDDPDTFRIKIWYEEGREVLVYDNGVNQPIGGGSILVHTKK